MGTYSSLAPDASGRPVISSYDIINKIYPVDGEVIPDPNHREMAHAKSTDAAFAKTGDQMPPGTLLPDGNTIAANPEASATAVATGKEPSQATDIPAQTPTAIPPKPPLADTPTPTQTANPGNVLTPEIAHDPRKQDITAENPSCGNIQEVPVSTGKFIWPSPYQALSGGSFRQGHPGFDLNAPEGSPLYATDTGLVIFAGWTGVGYGNTVMMDHGNGFRSLYAHLSQISTFCGAKVHKGKIIGLSGNTGNSSGPHLHFEVRVPGGWINPLSVLPVP